MALAGLPAISSEQLGPAVCHEDFAVDPQVDVCLGPNGNLLWLVFKLLNGSIELGVVRRGI